MTQEFTWKTSLTWGRKTTCVDQPVHAILAMCNLDIKYSLESLEIIKNYLVAHRNNNNNRRRQDYKKAYIPHFLSPFVISKLLLNLKSIQYQTWYTRRPMCSQLTHQNSAQLDIVCLHKLFTYQNCSLAKLQLPELKKLLLYMKLY
jgi:hypothetical protein